MDPAIIGSIIGAVATVLVAVIGLVIRSRRGVSNAVTVRIRGNVLREDGTPVEGALVFVEGNQHPQESNAIGWFEIEVTRQQSWVVKASHGGEVVETSVSTDKVEEPVRLVVPKEDAHQVAEGPRPGAGDLIDAQPRPGAEPVRLAEPQSPILDRYEVQQELYDSPLSQVLEVTDRHDGKSYLLKRIKSKVSYDPSIVDRLRGAYEGEPTSGKVAIPVRLHRDDQHFYEILEYYSGWTIRAVAELNQGGIYGRLLEDLASDILRTLRPLHAEGLVHRDLNPYNVLLTSETLTLVPLDFSNAVDLRSDREYQPIVVPGFTAPEERAGEYSPRNDVYSVGALLLYMNSGKAPPTYEERRYRGVDVELTNVTRGQLEQAIYKMLALDPTERFTDANEAHLFLEEQGGTEIFDPSVLGKLRLPDGSKITMGRHDWHRVEPE